MALFSKDQPAPKPPTVVARTVDGSTTQAGTYLGPDVVIEGTVSGTEPVFIEGTVRGKINLQSDLRIGTKARVDASVHAKNVSVEGRVNGDISADDRLELVLTASVDGNIKAPKIIVAEGAKFRGSVDMGAPTPREGAHDTAKKS